LAGLVDCWTFFLAGVARCVFAITFSSHSRVGA
jgi:hypothetical protein